MVIYLIKYIFIKINYSIASSVTNDADGRIEWYSGDPEQNPSRRGVEPIGGSGLEGFRTLRVAYEPKLAVNGGCSQEAAGPVWRIIRWRRPLRRALRISRPAC